MRTEQYFDERSASWTSLYEADPRFERRLRRIASLMDRVLPREGGLRALDAGCGAGVFSKLLAERGFKVTAIDASESMIAAAERLHSDDRIEYDVRTIESFESIDRFHAIVSLSMLEYVPDDQSALGRFHDLLEPGGILVISVPNKRGLIRMIERMLFMIRRLSGDRVLRGRGEYLKYQRHQYDPSQFDRMLDATGFRKVEGLYLNPGIKTGDGLARLLERRWWSAMYCAAYRKM